MRVYGLTARLRAILMDDGEFATVIRGAGLALIIRVLAGVVGYVTAILLARWMGSSEYGYYSFAVAVIALLTYPATLGLPGAAVRFAAQYAAAKDWGRVLSLIETSSWLVLGCSALVALACITALLFFKEFLNPGYVVPLIVALVGLPFAALTLVRSEVMRGLGWLGLAWGPLQLGQPVVMLCIVMTYMIISTQALSAVTVVVASIVAYVGILIAQWRIWRTRFATKLSSERKVDIHRWLRTAVPFTWISIANIVLAQSGVIIVGLFTTPKDVAIYSAAAATSLLISYPLQSTNALSAPRFAALHAQERHAELQTLATDLTWWTFWPSLAIGLLLSLLGSTILGLFGPGFEQGYAVLVILTLGQLANAFTGPVVNLLNMTSYQAITAWVVGCTAILYVLLGLLMTPVWGNLGTAFVFTVATVISNIWLTILVARKLEIYPSILGASMRRSRTGPDLRVG
jgi:O-antigen/teichoic acid export membrane protein